MQLSQSASMRQEMRQLLTPRMIQSMEILQLPLMALEERIEQELEANPVLEMNADPDEAIVEDRNGPAEIVQDDFRDDRQALVVKENSDQSDDFARLNRMSEYLENEEFSTNGSNNFRQTSSMDGERDKKLEAMNNTAARSINLAEHLLGQWAFVDAPPAVKQAG